MDNLFSFDGADAVWQAWRDGLIPDPALTVSEWADRHRVLSSRDSAEPGRYRTDRTPYMREIMDALSPTHPPRRVVFMKSAQVGATTAGSNFIGYVIDLPFLGRSGGIIMNTAMARRLALGDRVIWMGNNACQPNGYGTIIRITAHQVEVLWEGETAKRYRRGQLHNLRHENLIFRGGGPSLQAP
jgi:hypothetical protein